MNEEREKIINDTKAWIEGFIIKHSICPFARVPYELGQIKLHVISNGSIEQWLEKSLEICKTFISEHPITTSNAFIIYPKKIEHFNDFLDYQSLLEFRLEEQNLNTKIQMVGFHPQFQYANEESDDASNLTNRSPYPMIHILRVDEVAKAIDEYGDTDRISKRNMVYLRNLKQP